MFPDNSTPLKEGFRKWRAEREREVSKYEAPEPKKPANYKEILGVIMMDRPCWPTTTFPVIYKRVLNMMACYSIHTIAIM